MVAAGEFTTPSPVVSLIPVTRENDNYTGSVTRVGLSRSENK